MPEVLLASFLILVGGILLYLCGNWLVTGSSSFALRKGVSKLIVGLTIVAFGTSAPELFISSIAALKGSSEIAIGNIVGSNIANIGLILGFAALIYPPRVFSSTIRFQIPFAIVITGIFLVMTINKTIGPYDAVILLICFALFTFYCIKNSNAENNNSDTSGRVPKVWREYLYIIAGIVGLAAGSEIFVRGAVDMARILKVNEFFIGLSIVALGTSLPELATSIVAATKRESELVVGNVIGSCIFNILLVMGVVGLIRPVNSPAYSIWLDMGVMMGLTVLLLPMLYTGRRLSRTEGVILLLIYTGYIIYITIRG
jgi:cation:H+ antiporter